MWHDFHLTLPLIKHYIFLIQNLLSTFLPAPFSSSLPLHPSHLPSSLHHLRPFALGHRLYNRYHCCLSVKHPVCTPVLSLYGPLKPQIVLSLFIWLPDIKRYMNSCSLSPLVLSLPEAIAAVNLSELLTVLSAVYIGCLWFAQAEF